MKLFSKGYFVSRLIENSSVVNDVGTETAEITSSAFYINALRVSLGHAWLKFDVQQPK